MRLDRYLQNAGVGSRSEVKQWIKKGQVLVDGQPASGPEQTVWRTADVGHAESRVEFRGQRVYSEPFHYYMLHKPSGVVTATRDKRERTVMDLLSAEGQASALAGYFPAGRLDKDTEGLLLITNDGELAHRLLSPGRHVPKTYLAQIQGKLGQEEICRLEQGVNLGQGESSGPALFEWADGEMERDRGQKEGLWVKLTIYEGKYHQVKRMFQAVGCQVTYLKRLSMGVLQLDPQLPRGACRELTKEEREALQSLKDRGTAKTPMVLPGEKHEAVPMPMVFAGEKRRAETSEHERTGETDEP